MADQVVAAAASTSALVPLQPCRLLDTRTSSRVAAGAIVEVDVVGRCGIPAGANAVVVTLTVSGAAAPGFLTGWDGASERPEVSNLNFGSGETRANTALLPLHDGRFALFAQSAVDLIVDVSGAFVETETATAGRFVAVGPARVADTRTAGALAPGTTVRVPLPEHVPADAVALAVTLTTADSPGAGYVTASPAGSPRPEASVLNTDGAGQTRAVGAIVPVSADGLDVYTSSGSAVIADVTGYFTGPSAPASAEGLFVAAAPRRLLDTRPGVPVYGRGSVADR